LKLLDISARNPNEESVTVVQPSGNKGKKQVSLHLEEKGTEFVDASKMVEGGFANVFNVVIESQLRVKPKPL